MCEPRKANKKNVSISDVRYEMMGAASSMNMPPEPLDNVEAGAFYMTDLYFYAKHAHAHIIAATHNLETLRKALSDIEFELERKGEYVLAKRMYNLLR